MCDHSLCTAPVDASGGGNSSSVMPPTLRLRCARRHSETLAQARCPHATRQRVISLGMNAAVTSAVSVVLLGSVTPYPVVAHLGPTPVRAPVQRDAWGSCPSHTLALDEVGLVNAKRAALLALPTVAKQVRPMLKIRGARVDVLRHTHRSGDILPTRRSCWGTAFKRSALVHFVLPAERASPALRGNLAFYVARAPQAWVVWNQVG